MKIKRITFILILISQISIAQYMGGDGDGFDNKIVSHFLQDNSFSIYKGGSGDGFASFNASASLGDSGNSNYLGGDGDGFAQNSFSGSMNGDESFAFYGGESDGFDSQMRGAFLNSHGDCVGGLLVQIDDDPILDGTYQGGNELRSKGKVRSGSSVTFNSANSILFEPGFLAENNTLFSAILKECLTVPINY